MKAVSTIFSYTFHPFIMPVLSIFLIFNINDKLWPYHDVEVLKNLLYILSSILYIALPFFSIFIFYKSNIIQSLSMESKDDRIPSIILYFFYSVTFYFYIKDIESIQPLIFSYFLSISISVFISIILSYFINLSFHNLALSLMLGMVIAVASKTYSNHDLYVYIIIGIIGILSTLRLYTEKNSLLGLFVSTILGLFVSYISVTLEISHYFPF